MTSEASGAAPAACWAYVKAWLRNTAQPIRQSNLAIDNNRRLSIPNPLRTNLTDLQRSIFSRHQLSFRIPDHQPYEIASGLHVETRLERDARIHLVLQRFVFQLHGHGFLQSLNEPAVAIEQCEHTSQD